MAKIKLAGYTFTGSPVYMTLKKTLISKKSEKEVVYLSQLPRVK
jgi:hypothetical protein